MASQFAQKRVSRLLGRFVRARNGATAVEFALIAAPFFFLLFAMLEIIMVFFVTVTMEHATMEVARTIRTGESQQAGQSSEDFLNAVCAEMNTLIPCNGNVTIDVRTYADFGDVNITNPIEDDELNNASFLYNPGEAGDIVVVRVFYTWQLQTPMIAAIFANLSDRRRLLIATAAFRNEPFGEV
ncbi:MAG: pilus assembly protein [Robiginitomaculum sp.]|nr:pilus assembly protein [Robiginitomaculum sp.]